MFRSTLTFSDTLEMPELHLEIRQLSEEKDLMNLLVKDLLSVLV